MGFTQKYGEKGQPKDKIKKKWNEPHRKKNEMQRRVWTEGQTEPAQAQEKKERKRSEK